MKNVLFLFMIILLGGCITDAGEKNAFELKARFGQIAMRIFMEDNENELKNPNPQFKTGEYWWQTLDKNSILYKSEIGIKTPTETMYDRYADCTNLALLSIWQYGYYNISGWSMMEDDRDNMHIIIIFKGNRVVSSRRSFIVKDLQDFYDEFDRYRFFNFYTPNFEEEITSGEVYKEGILEVLD